MKKYLAFIACFVFFFSFAFSSLQEGYYSYSFARLSYVKGDVFIQRGEDLGYEEGVVNLVLVEGDKLGTQEGRLEVHFGRRNYIRVGSFTQIDFVNLPRRGDDLIKFHLLSGKIFLRINFLEREKGFEIHTPDASFYILDEGLYRFDVRENKETELSVYEGAVEAAGEEGSELVRSEERLIVAHGYFQSDSISFYAGYEDSFALWNRSRDALHNRVVARRYLPSELYEYEVELAYNGRWVYERPYGYVWIPYVYHDQWRPYFYGRWVWYPIVGWNWVSYEPWGWSVYHYGRWHWRAGLGWYWIPTRLWGPAWVHWTWGYDYIGWCPLSYYGYPGVIVNNHFYGRYYDRNYPLHSRALTVIHKNQLQARRISKVALSQNKIARLGKISLSSNQPPVKPALNQFRIKNSIAEKVLSRSNIRRVKKGYVSTKTLGSFSRFRSIKSRTLSGVSAKSRSSRVIKSRSVESRETSNPKVNSKMYSRLSPDLKAKELRNSREANSNFYRISRSEPRIKTYPSRQKTSTYSRSRAISSSSYKSHLQSSISKSSSRFRSSPYYMSRSEPSVKRYASRSSSSFSESRSSRSYIRQRSNYIRQDSTYTRSRLKGSSSVINRRVTSPSFKRSSSRSFRSSTYRSYVLPARNYSKIRSSSRSKVSPSRSDSSRRLSRSTSRSSFKSSSSRSSSSSGRSSSRKIKKR